MKNPDTWPQQRHSAFCILHSAFVYSTFCGLLAKLFQLRLSVTTSRGDQAVVSLRADGVHFTVHSCARKSSVRPIGFLGLHAVIKLLEVALQPGQFLGNVRAVGEINHFFQHAVFFDVLDFQAGVLDPLDQLLAVTLWTSGAWR